MSKEPQFKVIDIDKIPRRVRARSSRWLETLKRIPEGKAWVTNEKDLGVTPTSLSIVVKRYVKEDLLPKGFKVVTRKQGNTTMVYVLNSAETPP